MSIIARRDDVWVSNIRIGCWGAGLGCHARYPSEDHLIGFLPCRKFAHGHHPTLRWWGRSVNARLTFGTPLRDFLVFDRLLPGALASAARVRPLTRFVRASSPTLDFAMPNLWDIPPWPERGDPDINILFAAVGRAPTYWETIEEELGRVLINSAPQIRARRSAVPLRRDSGPHRRSELGHVWTDPGWQGFSSRLRR